MTVPPLPVSSKPNGRALNVEFHFNPLSGRGGEGCCNPPFRIFPRAVFAFFLRLPFGQLTNPLSRCPSIYEKIFQKFFAVKQVGGRGVATSPPRPEREGVAAKININFRNFHFLIFSFCHNND